MKEWFEYGDDPFYFKVETKAVLTAEMIDFFSEMIGRVKNTRSHIRALDIRRNLKQRLYTGAGQFQIIRPPAVIDGYSIVRKSIPFVYTGAAVRQSTQKETVGKNG